MRRLFDIVGFGCAAAAMMLVAACTSTESTLDPNALGTQQAAEPPAPATTPATPAPLQPGAAAASAPAAPAPSPVSTTPRAASIQLASVLGAPSQAVNFLTARLVQQGPAKNLTIAPGLAGANAYALKGFLSTSPENGKTYIFYSWEISDQSGVSLHRLSGKQPATGQEPDWTAVTQVDMEAVADQTLDSFSAWLATR